MSGSKPQFDSDPLKKLGLIAGNGVFPLEVARAARVRGVRVIAVAHRGESLPELEALVDKINWINVGQVQQMIDFFKAGGVDQAAMAGGITRARLAESFTPDSRAVAMMSRMARFSDDAVLRALAAELESEGIPMIDPVPMLTRALAESGPLAGPAPQDRHMKDLELAFSLMRVLGKFDVGQAVAIHSGIVAAVEAVEGTDAALRRAAVLCGAGMVVAKMAKAGQDMRFDRPAIGPATIELLAELRAAMIGVEAGQALILERSRTFALAAENGITIYGHD
ncbi:MAG: UDP-2,3-diacylglucosamine diphosphatase LpxI [Candidatus Binataceae bacterium]|nr:UDP-2,3-diacylglucosamine diphosphatase LpxI [Candidatus Binataceae bacterium]